MNENDPMDETCLSTVIKQKLLCAFFSVQKSFRFIFAFSMEKKWAFGSMFIWKQTIAHPPTSSGGKKLLRLTQKWLKQRQGIQLISTVNIDRPYTRCDAIFMHSSFWLLYSKLVSRWDELDLRSRRKFTFKWCVDWWFFSFRLSASVLARLRFHSAESLAMIW